MITPLEYERLLERLEELEERVRLLETGGDDYDITYYIDDLDEDDLDIID